MMRKGPPMAKMDDFLPMDEPVAPWLATRISADRLPDWIASERLPSFALSNGQETPAWALVVLMQSSKAADRKILGQLQPHLPKEAMARLVAELFKQWIDADSPSKHQRWVFQTLSEWGGEDAAALLGNAIRRWPRERKHARARQGLMVLGQMGSLSALAQIEHVRGTASQPAMRAIADELLDQAAQSRGQSLDELADETVPTAGLSPEGTLSFSQGGRIWTAYPRPDLLLAFRDPAGMTHASPPRRLKRDPSPVVDWKVVKKTIRETTTYQEHRLEEGMVQERTWPYPRWRSVILGHPLLRLIAQRVVWGSRDLESGRETTFRVAEDFTLADDSDDLVSMAAESTIRISHPIYWTDQLRERWDSIFADYGIEQPFEQLRRERHVPRPEERAHPGLFRYHELEVDGRRLQGTMVRHGWKLGVGVLRSHLVHEKEFPAHRLTVAFHHGPIYWGADRQPAPCKLGVIEFVQKRGKSSEIALSLGDVPPVVFSETVRIMDRLARGSAR